MVIISSNIQSQIQTLIEQYVNYRTKGEYGINAFWYWYYQVMSYLRNMDSIRLRVGFNLKYRMPKWGTVGYTKIVVGKDVIVYADTFIYNWLNHKSNRNPSYSVCDNCFGFKTILYDNSQKYAILKPTLNLIRSMPLDLSMIWYMKSQQMEILFYYTCQRKTISMLNINSLKQDKDRK